ncbi:hypothetical protein P280DRAFT_435165 [Massarina eburnea CBS 473.64]|uniref:NACHT domain-containing protein n=1 Tax=Massarina eburnea CBS 473.64 TaxID=1395130 RepID=A0A6A6RLH4_9PLEO|nr:hypothetical protein P280DRAFT_435165 [Massarina eburnea CBS 473.64]
MDPLTALGACSSILQIVDFSCKILSKGNQLCTSLTGALPENAQLEKVTVHLHGMVGHLQQQPPGQGHMKEMITMCIENANDLISVLDGLKVKGNARKWKSWRQAIKSVWRKERLEEMLARLQLIRDEIEFGIILDLREDIISLSAQQSIRFNSLDHSTQAILQAVLNGQSASTTASNIQLQAINDLNLKLETLIVNEHQQTRKEIVGELRQQNAQAMTMASMTASTLSQIASAQQSQENTKTDIMTMLKFTAIDDRQSAIVESHRMTFEWIWRYPRHDQPVWSDFWRWLTAEEGIYWVTGKAGSGKSTLMKYIYHDDRTRKGLQYWSNQTTVVTVSFFFWNSGSRMQKSLLGLLQGLLCSVLEQRKDLKEVVFPKDIQLEISEKWKSRAADTETIFSIRDLQAAFNRLLQIPSLKICLFIDGLDEFEGDNNEIAELFKGIITSPSVKACLSSRPLVAFERSFASCPRLRLQDLTHSDIKRFVRDTLEGRPEVLQMSLADPLDFKRLVQTIISKASGVFLWVSLAVRSLIEGLSNYDRMADLQYRLKELPDDLSDLYWHMLRSIKPKFYLEQAAELLMIMHASYKEKLIMRPDVLALAEEYIFSQPLPKVPCAESVVAQNLRGSTMEGRLISRCRGLLEVKEQTFRYHVANAPRLVSFLHQSVIDWLERQSVQDTLRKHIKTPFNPYGSLLATYLIETKSNDSKIKHLTDSDLAKMDLMFDLARKAQEIGELDLNLVEQIETVWIDQIDTTPDPGIKYWYWPAYLPWAGILAHRNFPRPVAWNDTFLSLSLQRGLVSYVSDKLDQGAPYHQGPQKRPLLHFAIDSKNVIYWQSRGTPNNIYDACRMLLSRGADPNEHFREWTVWETVLFYASGGCPFLDATLSGYYKSSRQYHDLTIWLEIIDIFLDYGADPKAGVVDELSTGGFLEITPVALVVEKIFTNASGLTQGKRALQIYDKIIALGGYNEQYLRPARESSRLPLWDAFSDPGPKEYIRVIGESSCHVFWDVLPDPDPEDIPRVLYRDLNDFMAPPKKTAKPYPDSEGLIPYTPAVDQFRYMTPRVATPPGYQSYPYKASHFQKQYPQSTLNTSSPVLYTSFPTQDPFRPSSTQSLPNLQPYTSPSMPQPSQPSPISCSATPTYVQHESPYPSYSPYPPYTPPYYPSPHSAYQTPYASSSPALSRTSYTPSQTSYQAPYPSSSFTSPSTSYAPLQSLSPQYVYQAPYAPSPHIQRYMTYTSSQRSSSHPDPQTTSSFTPPY